MADSRSPIDEPVISNLEDSLALSGPSALRKAISKKEPAVLETRTLQTYSVSLIETILDKPVDSAREEIEAQLCNLYSGLQNIFDFAEVPPELRKRRFIHKTGVAISPQHALGSIRDVHRVSSFVRAVDKAIGTLKKRFNEPLHIIYPACGPLAPLALPLLIYYKASGKYSGNELQFTFIDIQEGAIRALLSLIKAAELESFVKNIHLIDAVDYVPPSGETIHMVMLEAMQHGFSREGHLAIALHYAPMLAEGGLFLPERITIQAYLANPQNEFVEQWKEAKSIDYLQVKTEIQNARIHLGEVLCVDQTLFQSLKIVELDEYTSLLECGTFKIPHYDNDDPEHAAVIIFSSEVDIYDGERVREYDSGITHPLPDLSICVNFIPNDKKEDDLYVKSGDQLKFFYRMNGIPGFFVMKVEP